MTDVTRLIDAAAGGDRAAAAALLPLVYDELRQLAAARMAAEPAGHTLDPTALVHEAYLRLIGTADAPRWDGRGHFFAAAAAAMRRILIDHARAKRAAKRGGPAPRAAGDAAAVPAPEPAFDLLALDDALTRFAAIDPAAAELVQLRYFAGLSAPQAAEALGVTEYETRRRWAYARAWLRDALGE